ncbi:MAG: hypothetical protein FWE25_06975 [Lachnospiraceae bacterium]|nr:hypothetical protein [Lachnospiraceae bacterium]
MQSKKQRIILKIVFITIASSTLILAIGFLNREPNWKRQLRASGTYQIDEFESFSFINKNLDLEVVISGETYIFRRVSDVPTFIGAFQSEAHLFP